MSKNVVKCPVCKNVSRSGFWRGTVKLEDDTIVNFKGYVKFHSKDDSFHLDTLIRNIERASGQEAIDFDGEAQCLECGGLL